MTTPPEPPAPDGTPPEPPPTTPPPPEAPPAASRTGCGCLGKGCLAGCLAAAVLPLLLLVVAAVMWRTGSGSSYVGDRIERWRQQNQLVDYAFSVIDFVRPAPKPETETATGGSKRLPGVNDKRALPADVPVYPKPTDETYSIGDGRITAFQRVQGPAAPVISHFRNAMPKHGWRLTSERKASETTLLMWERPGRGCKVEVVQEERVSEVWLRCQPKMKGKGTSPGAGTRSPS